MQVRSGNRIPVPVPALAERQERHDRDLAEHAGLRRVTSLRSSTTAQRSSSSPSPTPRARSRASFRAATSFNGQPDWFVDFAFPVSTLVAKGVIASAGDLARALFFPATSTNPNNYNKSYLNCPFQPGTVLQIAKSVTPTAALPTQVTPVTYSIDVQNAGARAAKGVLVEDKSVAGFLGNIAVQVTTDDPDADLSMATSLPVRVPDPRRGTSPQRPHQWRCDARLQRSRLRQHGVGPGHQRLRASGERHARRLHSLHHRRRLRQRRQRLHHRNLFQPCLLTRADCRLRGLQRCCRVQ